ncbi:MAG: HNH endonuclease [Vicinamibacteria bacterium]
MKHELTSQSFSKMSDDELLRRLSELLQSSRCVESQLVAHIGEVDARRLYAREAAPSMFAYCTEVLHLSEHEAYLRINVARASREHPLLLEMLAQGRLHLSGIAKLAPCLTEANRETLLARAAGKSKREIEELVAEVSPKPDVPTKVRKLPDRGAQASPAVAIEVGPHRHLTKLSLATALNDASQLGPDRVVTYLQTPGPARSVAPAKRPAIEPLAPARYKVQFTASAGLYEKLNRLKVLMQSSVPDGDLAAIIEAAVTEKLERLEAKRFGKTNTPRKSLKETSTAPSSRYIPAPVRRAVRDRDGNQCAFVAVDGRRCGKRDQLEFHHTDSFGRGGDHSVENIQLLCKGTSRNGSMVGRRRSAIGAAPSAGGWPAETVPPLRLMISAARSPKQGKRHSI